MQKVIFNNIEKTLKKLPFNIVKNLQKWALMIEALGINEVRKIPGYHDELLKGDRYGQRSVRLSKAYRAIYIEYNDGDIDIISVEEVSKHEY